MKPSLVGSYEPQLVIFSKFLMFVYSFTFEDQMSFRGTPTRIGKVSQPSGGFDGLLLVFLSGNDVKLKSCENLCNV